MGDLMAKDPCKTIEAEKGDLRSLVRLVACLRSENGCPWDRKQTPRSLAVYLIEEIYELVDAIESDDPEAVCEELGDVLFQLVFVARLYEETGHFRMTDAVRKIADKMIRRHPHVFGETEVDGAEDVRRRWGEIKKAEKGASARRSVIDSVPTGLPALMRAYRMSERAAGAGFDWEDMAGVSGKVEEEWAEFRAAQAVDSKEAEAAEMEMGDLLFTLVNVARFARIHPETALSKATRKFERRFRDMEAHAEKTGRRLDQVPRPEMEALWDKAKNRIPDS